jgi:integrase
MRLNEICQLQLSDIKRVGSIPCVDMDVSDEDETQNLKSRNSFRTIPVHPTLLQMGFLYFVERRKEVRVQIRKKRNISKEELKRQNQLFYTMTYSKVTEKYSKNFSNFYNKFNREKITEDPKKSFHSLRHSHISLISNKFLIDYAASYINGQKFNSVTFTTYAKPDMSTMATEISHVKFDFDIFMIFNKEPLSDEIITEQAKLLPAKED